MFKRRVVLGLACIAFAACGQPARAQWGYPDGFGMFGWGGWGGTSLYGDEARGMGMFAAGMGQYNLHTAKAESINADTTMRFNEYIWQSQQVANQRYQRRQVARRERSAERVAARYAQLRDNPDRVDVQRGDALNLVLDELSAPGVFSRSTSAANVPIASSVVKGLPFRYAPQAITISLEQLASQVPALIKDPAFEKERLALKELVAKARTESETNDQVSAETLKSVQAAVKVLHEKIKSVVPAGRERAAADNFLKAAYGLARMMEAPEIGAFLRELDKYENTTLAALLGFMYSFNLRFGAATTPAQRTAYDDLFGKLRTLRDRLFPEDDAPVAIGAPAHPHPEWAQDFFSGMDLDDVEQKKPLTPAKPAAP